jgi:hypothetical protein
MRNLIAIVLITFAALVAGPALAADMPYNPPPPPVDAGLGGSFYLRASVGIYDPTAHDVSYQSCSCGGAVTLINPITSTSYGYSYGVGFGYEAGNGLRADVTLDQLGNGSMSDGTYTVNLRSTIAMANAYYDFGLGGHGLAGGGFGAYVGAGIGGAYNQTHVNPAPGAGPDGSTFTAAGALMTGVTYDMGNMVADLGYRMIYMPQISNGDAAVAPASPFYINQAVIHEVRGTIRYRFN